MRKGTQWLILVLTTAAFALVAYYLLPIWWAQLVNVWVGASNSWVTGLVLGFIPVAVGSAAVRAVWQIGRTRHRNEADSHDTEEAREGNEAAPPRGARLAQRFRPVQRLRPVLSAVAGLSIVVLALTVFIALGVTEPLQEAQHLWRDDAPGLLAATLVGALLGIIGILVFHSLKLTWQRKKASRELTKANNPPSSGAGEEDVSKQ